MGSQIRLGLHIWHRMWPETVHKSSLMMHDLDGRKTGFLGIGRKGIPCAGGRSGTTEVREPSA